MTNKLFVDIYGNVGTNVQDTSSSMATIIKGYCNNSYREILRRINWEGKNLNYQITTVAGTQDYVLPSDFGKEIYVFDTSTFRYIPFIDFEKIAEDYGTSISSTGSISHYTVYDDVVLKQPSTASAIVVYSSSSSDTSQSVFIKGTDTNDGEISETVSLNGTTQVPAVNVYKSIRYLSKSGTTLGAISVVSVTGLIFNALFAPATKDYRVKKLRFHYIPNSAITINVPYYVRPNPMTNDYDAPVIDVADGIELGATAAAWRYKRQYAKAQEFERLFEKWIIDAIWDLENQPNQTHLLNVKPYIRDDD